MLKMRKKSCRLNTVCGHPANHGRTTGTHVSLQRHVCDDKVPAHSSIRLVMSVKLFFPF